MSTQNDNEHSILYTACAGTGVLIFFLGPTLALLLDVPALTAATVGYVGIMLFTGGVAARYGFARSTHPWKQLGLNLLVAAAVTIMFYGIFLLLFLM